MAINIIRFLIVQTIYVSLNTVCTIGKVKFKPWVTAILCAITYGLYAYVTIMVVTDDIDIWLKVLLTGITNCVGVLLSMNLIEKTRKPKRWDITVKAPSYKAETDELLLKLYRTGIRYYCEDITQPKGIYDEQVEFADYVNIHISTFSKHESATVTAIMAQYTDLDMMILEEVKKND